MSARRFSSLVHRYGLDRRALIAGVLAAGAAGPVRAQSGRQKTLVVPFAAGGAADIIGRTVAERLGAAYADTVIVENRPGAGSNIGLAAVAKGPKDGSLFGLASVALAVNPSLYKSMPFDVAKDIAPLTLALETPNVVIVPSSSPIRSIADLIAAAKAKPGGVSYASAGIGSSLHLAAILFAQMAGVSLTHVPYRGTNPAMSDLIGGRVDVMFDNASTAIPQATSGTVRAIAVTTAKRVPALPDVPTVGEQGLPDYVLANWWAFIGPAGLPSDIASKLGDDIRTALRADATRKSMEAISGTIVASTSDAFRAHLDREIARWRQVVASAGIEPT